MALTPEQAQRRLAELRLKQLRAKAAAVQKKEPDSPTWRDRATALAEGASLGWGNEISSAVAAVPAWIGDESGQSFSDVYRDIQGSENDRLQSYREQNPNEAMALELGGALATGGLGLSRALAAKGITTAGNFGRTAGVIGAESALAGAGSAEEGKRLQGAGVGAATGLATAGLFKGGSGLVNSMAKRRIAQDLIAPDGSKIPIHMTAAPHESGLADFYRSGVGSTFGGGNALMGQQDALVNAADEAITGATTKAARLQAKADRIKKGYETTKLQESLDLGQRVNQIQQQGKAAVSAAKQAVADDLGHSTRALNMRLRDQALPVVMPPDTR